MKKSELKQIIQEVVSEIYEMEHSNLKEKATNQVKEMWMALEGDSMSEGHDETDMSNPEEKKEVTIAKKIKKHVDAFLKMHGQLKEDGEADMSDPAEKKEVDHAKEIKKLADELISMHKS